MIQKISRWFAHVESHTKGVFKKRGMEKEWAGHMFKTCAWKLTTTADKPISSNTCTIFWLTETYLICTPAQPLDQLEASCFLDSSSIMLLILNWPLGLSPWRFLKAAHPSINGRAEHLRRDIPPRLHGLLFLLLPSAPETPLEPLGTPWRQATPCVLAQCGHLRHLSAANSQEARE